MSLVKEKPRKNGENDEHSIENFKKYFYSFFLEIIIIGLMSVMGLLKQKLKKITIFSMEYMRLLEEFLIELP